MNAIDLHAHIEDKKTLTPEVVERRNLKLMFIETLTKRIDELDCLLLKTECAMKLSIQSKYWSRRHEETYRELGILKKLNNDMLFMLEMKRRKNAVQ